MSEAFLYEGYLVKSPEVAKHLHNTKKWHRKWFTLDSSGELLSYDSERSSKISGPVLPIPNCKLIFDPKLKGVQLGFCLGLEFRDSTVVYLKAESAQIFNDWLRVLGRFAEKCEMEELPDRRSTLVSEDYHLGGRSPSVSSVQSRHLRPSVKSRFQKKEGLMSKTGGNNKGWKERYFVLNNGKLSYYKNDKSLQSALGTIDLFDCSSVSLASGKKGFGLDLYTPSRVFNFSTESAAEQSEWIASFTHTLRVIADIKDAPTGGVASSWDDSKSVGSDLSLEKSHEDERVTSTELTLDVCVKAPSTGEDKDGVVPLLEAEVEALRGKVSSLEADLRSSASVNGKLQQQLMEEKDRGDKETKKLKHHNQDLQAQVQQLERTKEEMEAVNDSVQTQLEEEQDRNQVLEENVIGLRHEVEEQQVANAAIEEELSDTQMKLQEIEAVAKELEVSLRRRSGSEPPDPSSIRSLNLSYQAKMEEKEKRYSADSTGKAELLEEDPIGGRVTSELISLKEKLSSLEKEKEELLSQTEQLSSMETLQEELKAMRETVESLNNEKTSLTEQLELLQSSTSQNAKNHSSPSKSVATSQEERLKWQVEMSNIRREMEGKLEKGRKEWEEERAGLRQEVAKLKEEVANSGNLTQQLELVQAKLDKSNLRTSQLEAEVQTSSERASQLLVEKEKALADLKTIRKTNRSMEKRLSESEDLRRTGSPLLSASNSSSPLPLLDEQTRLVDSERRLAEMRSALSTVQKERDQLKEELENVRGRQRAPSSTSHSFSFIGKTGPTLSTTNQSAESSMQAPPTSVGVMHNLPHVNGSDGPPPKPKKPPKELMNRLNQSSAPARPKSTSLDLSSVNGERNGGEVQDDSIRSRTGTLLHVLFVPAIHPPHDTGGSYGRQTCEQCYYNEEIVRHISNTCGSIDPSMHMGNFSDGVKL